MLNFLAENLGTIIIGAVLLGIVALIIYRLCKNRKEGKNSCGCGCDNCPSKEMCHKK